MIKVLSVYVAAFVLLILTFIFVAYECYSTIVSVQAVSDESKQNFSADKDFVCSAIIAT